MPWIIPIGAYRVRVGDLLKRVIALGLIVIAALAVRRHLPVAWKDQASDLFPVLGVLGPILIGLSLIIPWLWQKKQAGSVLLDLGPSARRKGWLILGISSVLIGLGLMASAIILKDYGDSTREVRLMLFFLSLAALLPGGIGLRMYLGLGRFRITESGIFLGQFLKWERIECYEWGGKNDRTLTVKIRSRLPFVQPTSLEIPAVHKANVDDLLAEHLSDVTTGVGNGT
jgi:hypothetical protein